MTTLLVLIGVLLSSIIITIVQIRSTDRKQMQEINQLFEDVKYE